MLKSQAFYMKVFRMIAFYVGVTFMSSQTSVLAKRKENFSGPEQVTFNEESTRPTGANVGAS